MARARVRYEKNIEGLGRIMRSRKMAAMLAGNARRGKAYAETISPVETGEYAESFVVTSATTGEGRWADRAAAYLINASEHATLVEFADGYRILGQTVDEIERGA